ncbi:pyridoxamine 5'-phosphate oxidase family protein [Frigidibacter sp. MR17.24]|uniref:pyridoxamine 5'-phosphate oxidase family protein n=1 Tax=Frigidibacter sp. MR17.24 TaxID=3127345 RepID=UPI003012C164
MRTPEDLKHHLWKHLSSDRTLMIGLETPADDHPRPMTALVDEETGKHEGPLWIFTAKDTSLARALAGGAEAAVATFVAKNNDLYATIRGSLTLDTDRAVVERLWNPFVAAWYPEGKDDPSLVLLRFDLDRAEIWETGSSLVTGTKALFGKDLRDDFRDRQAEVSLH